MKQQPAVRETARTYTRVHKCLASAEGFEPSHRLTDYYWFSRPAPYQIRVKRTAILLMNRKYYYAPAPSQFYRWLGFSSGNILYNIFISTC